MEKPCKCEVQEPYKCCYAMGCAWCPDKRPCDPNKQDCRGDRPKNGPHDPKKDPHNCHACNHYALQCSRADCVAVMCNGYDVPAQCRPGGKCQDSTLKSNWFVGKNIPYQVKWCEKKKKKDSEAEADNGVHDKTVAPQPVSGKYLSWLISTPLSRKGH